MGPLDQTPIPIHWISSLFHLQGEIYPWLVNLLCLSHQSMNSTHILDQILAVCSLCESCLGRQDMPYLPPAFTAQTEVLLCLINQYTTMTDQRMTKADWDSIHGKTATNSYELAYAIGFKLFWVALSTILRYIHPFKSAFYIEQRSWRTNV